MKRNKLLTLILAALFMATAPARAAMTISAEDGPADRRDRQERSEEQERTPLAEATDRTARRVTLRDTTTEIASRRVAVPVRSR